MRRFDITVTDAERDVDNRAYQSDLELNRAYQSDALIGRAYQPVSESPPVSVRDSVSPLAG